MSFWTVEDAGPYKKYPNFLMRRSLWGAFFERSNFGERGIRLAKIPSLAAYEPARRALRGVCEPSACFASKRLLTLFRSAIEKAPLNWGAFSMAERVKRKTTYSNM